MSYEATRWANVDGIGLDECRMEIARSKNPESLIRLVADRTGRAPETVAEETRKGWPIHEGEDNDDGPVWTIDPGEVPR